MNSVCFSPKFWIWVLIYAIFSHVECPLSCSYFPKNYVFLTDKTRDAVYGRPPWAHKSIKETQFAGKTICCSTKQWGHTNHIKSHRFHFRISYLQLIVLYSLIPNHSSALILRNSQKLNKGISASKINIKSQSVVNFLLTILK